MARTRPSAQRRRKMRKNREKLRQAIAKQEQDEAGAATSLTQASATENVTEAAAEADTSASAHDAKETADATKTRPYKQRHIPDRHYYRRREDKLDGCFVALEQRLNDTVAKGCAAIDADYRSHNNVLRNNRERLVKKEEIIQRTLEQGMGSMKRVVARLERKVKNIADENFTLHEQLLDERRRVRQMAREHQDKQLELLDRLYGRP